MGAWSACSVKQIHAGCFAVALLTATVPAHAGSESAVYSFNGPDGQFPYAGLLNVGGTLYGTTFFGGNGSGTVFSVTPAGVETVVYTFNGSSDGAYPYAGLINVGGTLYGTTEYGGGSANCTLGCGTVFSVTPGGVETVVYTFKGGSDGSQPYAGLLNVGGTLYGTTFSGGAGGCGTVFKLKHATDEKLAYSFKCGSDGANPFAGLLNVGGTLYGTTEYGGGSAKCQFGCGTVFSVTPAGVETVVYAFKGGSDGGWPQAGLINVDGTLYGTTLIGGGDGTGCNDGGCGTVFGVTTAGGESQPYYFRGGTDGAVPAAGLINVGRMLYGTTTQGGTRGYGTVFKLGTLGGERLVYSFKDITDGGSPYAGLINGGSVLYGTTMGGGAMGIGTVFAVKP